MTRRAGHPGVRPRSAAARLLLSVALGAALGLAAQEVIPLVEDGAPAGPLGGGEALEETLAKCLADLKSKSAETRKSAVLILGKYRHPVAEAAVTAALGDPEAVVRRAAVVSLTEEDGPPPGASLAMLGRLDDPDVHVRRMVSSHLPELVMMVPRAVRRGPLAPDLEDDAPAALPAAVVKALRQAFADDDEIVRKNMLAAHPFVHRYVPPEVVVERLREPAAQNRILALQAARRVLKPDAFEAAVLFLADDPEPQVRLELARTLGRAQTPAVRRALEKLAADPDRAVAGEAWLALVYAGGAPDIDRLAAFLADPNADRQAAARLIHALPTLGEAATPMLLGFLGDDRQEYRAAALQSLMMQPRDPPVPIETLVGLLEDSSSQVRQLAAASLRATGRLDLPRLQALTASPHPDVREFVVRTLRTMPDNSALPLLADLLLDESGAIRQQVLMELARRQAPGWADTLAQALHDDDPDVFRTAVILIIQRRPPGAAKWLEEAAARCQDAELLPMIQAGIEALRSPQKAVPPAQADDDAELE